jgi:predicted GIY-YIG superfamily endonuclease
MEYTVYILVGPGKRYYVGSTTNVAGRLQRHNKGLAASYTKKHGQFVLAYSELYPTLAQARAREQQLKKWRRAKKAALIAGNLKLLKSL